MEKRLLRNLGALTADECALLRKRKVLVAGCGGLGGHLIDQLLRVGVGCIVAADGDVFEESNLNRQLLCRAETLGMNKACAAALYARSVAPDVRFIAQEGFITRENADEAIRGCDAVLDGLDSAAARRMLCRACVRAGVPFIHGAVSGWQAQAAVLTQDGAIEALYPTDAPATLESVLSFVPALCASMQVSLCVRLLCGREVPVGRLYCVDTEEPEMTEVEVCR